MERFEFVSDIGSCRSLHRLVASALIEGEPAEAIIAGMAGLDRSPGDAATYRQWGPIDGTIRRWHQWSGRYAARARPLPSHQVDKALRVIQPYIDQLERLPAGAKIERVGPIALVDDELRAVMATWPGRVEDGSNLVAVHHEVRSSMASLTKARMMLDLGLLRLVD